MNGFEERIRRKIDSCIINNFSTKKWYKYLYRSFWHYKLTELFGNNNNIFNLDKSDVYITSGMNYGAGIAHQLHCWYSGNSLAVKNGIGFAYPSFWINGGHAEENDNVIKKLGKLVLFKYNSHIWDECLGFGENVKNIEQLKKEKFVIRKLPYYSFSTIEKIKEFEDLINSYCGKKVVLVPSVDQTSYCENENEEADLLRKAFWNSSSRERDKIVFDKNVINIAVHIRRGDVSEIENSDRFLDMDYYHSAISTALGDFKDESVHIYIFSEGKEQDFSSFLRYKNVKLCLDWDSKKTFLHMIYADAIITGVSGFSIYAAIIGNGKRYAYYDSFIKYCSNLEWIILGKDGKINNADNKILEV